MRRVVDAAEAGVRERMERKVLKAASLGYTKGVAAGRQAEAQDARASRDAAREKAPSVEDAVPLSAKRAGSDAGVDDAASIFSEDSAAVAAEGALSREDRPKKPSPREPAVRRNARKAAIPRRSPPWAPSFLPRPRRTPRRQATKRKIKNKPHARCPPTRGACPMRWWPRAARRRRLCGL
jgi:hypothetical protein